MKRLITLLYALLLLGIGHLHSQTILSIGGQGVIGLPDTVRYGDTIQGLTTYLRNDGNFTVGGVLVQMWADPNQGGNPFQIGSFNILPTAPLGPGDSVIVPLNMFIVSPQNTNNGSNVMVVWPAAPGNTPGDSSDNGYYLDDDPVGFSDEWTVAEDLTVYPNPSQGEIYLQTGLAPEYILKTSVYRIDGSLHSSYEGLPGQISLADAAEGMFFIRIEDTNGRFVSRRILHTK